MLVYYTVLKLSEPLHCYLIFPWLSVQWESEQPTSPDHGYVSICSLIHTSKVESHSNSKHSDNGLGLVRYFISFVIQMSVIQILTEHTFLVWYSDRHSKLWTERPILRY